MNYRSLLILGMAAAMLARAALEVDVDEPQKPDGANAPKPGIFVPKPADERGADDIPVDPFGSVLVFKNGDRLHGKLASIHVINGLVWQRQDTAAPATFKLPGVYGVKLARGRVSDMVRKSARVFLTNGDVIVGDIVSLDAEYLRLATSYAGELRIKRYMVGSIMPPSKRDSQVIYEGPTDLNEWTKSSGEWEVRRGILTGYGRVGADLKLPAVARIRFTVIWPGRYTNFSVALYAADIRNFYNDAYHLTFSGNNVALHRRSQAQGTLNLGQVEVPRLMSRQKSRFELLVNREDSRFALFIDDQLVKEWSDPQGFAGGGTGLVFNGPDRNAPIGISDITIAAWDGKLGQMGDMQASDHDVVQFVNFDRISGEVTAIANDALTFKTPFNTLDIPLERVVTIALAQARAQQARRYAQDVELYFSEGEKITIRLGQMADDKLTGYSENLGDVTFDMSPFQSMRFNIYDEDEAVREMDGVLFDQPDLSGLIIE